MAEASPDNDLQGTSAAAVIASVLDSPNDNRERSPHRAATRPLGASPSFPGQPPQQLPQQQQQQQTNSTRQDPLLQVVQLMQEQQRMLRDHMDRSAAAMTALVQSIQSAAQPPVSQPAAPPKYEKRFLKPYPSSLTARAATSRLTSSLTTVP